MYLHHGQLEVSVTNLAATSRGSGYERLVVCHDLFEEILRVAAKIARGHGAPESVNWLFRRQLDASLRVTPRLLPLCKIPTNHASKVEGCHLVGRLRDALRKLYLCCHPLLLVHHGACAYEPCRRVGSIAEYIIHSKVILWVNMPVLRHLERTGEWVSICMAAAQ